MCQVFIEIVLRIDGKYIIYVARLRNGGKIRFSTYL
jgi:hypothetical protein